MVLLLLLFGNDAEELKKISVDKKHQLYLKQLCDTLNHTDENTDWVKYLHIEDSIEQKSILSANLERLLDINSTASEICTFTKSTVCDSGEEEYCWKKVVLYLKSIWSKIRNLFK